MQQSFSGSSEAISHMESLFGVPRPELLELLDSADQLRLRTHGCHPASRVLDHTAIVGLATGRNKHIEAAVWRSVACDAPLLVPAVALATALGEIQEVLHPLIDAVTAMPSAWCLDFDRQTAFRVAKLISAHGDAVDLSYASAIVTAQRFNTPLLVTSRDTTVPTQLGVLVDETPPVPGVA
ncbi:hypothetical protein AB0392_48965 [Nonomuraea angiospora]|uniref:hypothetical protein n=1 Tax=Nonomuraea angiospora TaxID=46172 RepID=UPI00344B4A85